ncbi:hypothetical protein C8J30_102336 [Rhodobacter viridis]|uniref:DUF3786 domain-containing protein n=1 Tax=Rhodobacter viridis TaxID=1054202 RepID=A0A318U3F6_9RHOB|nr:hypothetical protein [Rhodobacter viridis]PYF12021.1 hypothetical protein C8J30_102336 [Rhodobacter viridis]
MNLDAETLIQQIPYYLSAQDQKALLDELTAISRGGTAEYLLSTYRDSFKEVMLQGDGWSGLQLFLFDTGDRKSVRGIVLSNSCDVDPENPRDVPARVIFAPLVKLAAFKTVLDASGIGAERIAAKIAAIKAQKTTNIFYLPAGGPLKEDYVVRFDDAHNMPVAAHTKSADREKLFTLSNTGFYMFVLKLSVHFCRLQEKVNRKPAEAAT